MTGWLREEQIEYDGIRLTEVWNLAIGHESRVLLDGEPAPGKPDRVREEWIKRQSDHAKASGFGAWMRVSIDPNDPSHILHEAWVERPADEGPPRWFAGD